MIRLSSIIETFEAEFLEQYADSLPPSHRQALAAMKDCRTSASPLILVLRQYNLDGVLAQCTACEHRVLVPHSCGHRSCPHCQHHESQQWLERQLQKQLPGEYVLLTFTLPGELRGLAWHHQRTLYSLLIACAWDTVKTFTQNDTQLRSRGSRSSPNALQYGPKCCFRPIVAARVTKIARLKALPTSAGPKPRRLEKDISYK